MEMESTKVEGQENQEFNSSLTVRGKSTHITLVSNM